MKKAIKASLVVAAALAFGCAAVACGDDNPGKKPPQEPTKVTVTFDLGYSGLGVENPAPQTVDKGATIVEPEDIPERAGRTFEGWYVGSLDGTKFDFATPVNEDMTLVANWVVADGYYIVKYSAAADATGTAPEEAIVANGTIITIPENPFAKDGWTFYRWKNMNTGGYLVSNQFTVSADIEFRAVFEKEYKYSNYEDESDWYAGTIVHVYDDGNFVEEIYEEAGELTPYSINPWYGYLEFDGWSGPMSYRLNDNGTFDVADGMEFAVIIADDGETELTFDGFGKAFLGEHEGTYSDLDPRSSTITLKFGEITYSGLEYGMDEETYIPNSLTAEITIDGTTYTFGKAERAPWEGTIPDKYIGTYTGQVGEDGATYVIEITADKITVTVDDGDPVDAVIYAYTFEEDEEYTLEFFDLEINGVSATLIKAVEEDGEVAQITFRSGDMLSGMTMVNCTRVAADD